MQKIKFCEDAVSFCNLLITPEEGLMDSVTLYTSNVFTDDVSWKWYAWEVRLAFIPLPNAQSFKRLVLELQAQIMVDIIWHLLCINLTHLTIKGSAYPATQWALLIIAQHGRQLQLKPQGGSIYRPLQTSYSLKTYWIPSMVIYWYNKARETQRYFVAVVI